jgi:hypothetical protein
MLLSARVILAIFFLFLTACSQTTPTETLEAQAPSWVATNPGGGGAFNSPVITKSGYWAVGSDLSGVYLSKNKGVSWTIIGAARGLTETHVASLLALPSNNQSAGKLIIGSGNGIYTGLEDGTLIKKTYPNGYISALAVSANPNVVYAAWHPEYNLRSPKVLRSNDAGESWNVVSTNLPSFLRVVGLRTHPVDEDAVVVLAGEGRFNHSHPGPNDPLRPWYHRAFLSNDGGASWTRLGGRLGRVMDITYGVDPSNLNRMYLTILRNNNAGSLYASEDAGGTWTKLADRTGVILLDSASPNRLRLQEFQVQRSDGSWEPNITTGLWESTNGGSSWQFFASTANLTPGWSNAHNVWPLGSGFQGYVQTLGNNSVTANTVLWSDSQFVRVSTDGGKTWRDTVSSKVGSNWKSRGVDNAVPAIVAPSAADANLVYAGYYDMGLWRSDDGGGSWKSLNVPQYAGGWGAAVGGNTLTVAPDPSNPSVVWAQLGGNLGGDTMYLVKSTNRGDTWTEQTSGLPANKNLLESLSIDAASPASSRKLYVIAGTVTTVNGSEVRDADVYRSSNGGSSWSKVFDCNSCLFTSVVSGVVYAGGPSGLWTSATGNLGTFNKLSLPTTDWTLDRSPRGWGYVGLVDVAVNGSTVWAAVLGKGFYRSTNSGTTWQLMRSDVFARSVAVDTATNEVYTGSSSALYAGGYDAASKGVNVYNGTSWRAMNAGLGYPFATMVRVSGTSKWLLSPGQGVLKWQ